MQQLDLDSTPTTQYTAQALGASPDSTKMIGTKAQKEPVLQERVAKEETLSGAQRLDEGRMQALPPEQAAAQKADRLKAFGSLGSRVETLVQQQMEQAGQAQQTPILSDENIATTLGINQEQLTRDLEDPNSEASQVRSLLQQLADNPTGDAAEQILVQLDALPGVSRDVAQNMIDTTLAATGEAVATSVIDNVTLGELDISSLGMGSAADVAQLIGVTPAELPNMSLKDLQDRVTQVQQAEFDRAKDLRARLASLPRGSVQRKLIMEQLRDLGQVGVIGAETEVAETVEDIDQSQMVMVGEEEYDINELLDDENLTNLIVDYLAADDKERDKIFPPEDFAGLRAWVDENQLALADLSTTIGKTTQEFETVQQEWKDLGRIGEDISLPPDVLQALAPGWNPEQSVTSATLTSIKSELQGTGIGQILFDEADPDRIALAGKLTPQNVEEIKQLELTPEQIKTASEYGDLTQDQMLADLAGVEASSAFVTNSQMQTTLDVAEGVWETLQSGNNTLWLEDQNFMQLDVDDKEALAENPDRYDEFQEYHQVQDDLDRLGDDATLEEVLSAAMGEPFAQPIETLQASYSTAQQMAAFGDPDAQTLVDKIQNLLGDTDGVLDETDAEKLRTKLTSELESTDVNSVIDGTLENRSLFDLIGDLNESGLETAAYNSPSSELFIEVQNYVQDDGLMDITDFRELDLGKQAQLIDHMDEWPEEYWQQLTDTYGAPGNDPTAIRDKSFYTKQLKANSVAEFKDAGEFDTYNLLSDQFTHDGVPALKQLDDFSAMAEKGDFSFTADFDLRQLASHIEDIRDGIKVLPTDNKYQKAEQKKWIARLSNQQQQLTELLNQYNDWVTGFQEDALDIKIPGVKY